MTKMDMAVSYLCSSLYRQSLQESAERPREFDGQMLETGTADAELPEHGAGEGHQRVNPRDDLRELHGAAQQHDIPVTFALTLTLMI